TEAHGACSRPVRRKNVFRRNLPCGARERPARTLSQARADAGLKVAGRYARRAGSAPTPADTPSRRGAGRAVVMNSTAASTPAAAASVRGVRTSAPKSEPRNMATIGFTKAYVATSDGA